MARYSKSEKVTEGFNQVSPSTADLFRRAPLKTDANGGIADWCPQGAVAAVPHAAKQRSASLINRPGDRPSLGYCTGMQDGDDEELFGIGCRRGPRRNRGPRPIRKRADRRLRRFLADRIGPTVVEGNRMHGVYAASCPGFRHPGGGFPCGSARWCFYKYHEVCA